MRKIEAIIRHSVLQNVQDALDQLGASGLTVTEVKGCGLQQGYTETYRGARANISLIPKLKIETVVSDSIADQAVETIARTASTGQVGDGRIFVSPVDAAVRIRTGERGDRVVTADGRRAWGH